MVMKKSASIERTAFSLIELGVVIVLAGILAGFFMKFSNAHDDVACYTETKAKLQTIDAAIMRFAMAKQRYPMPARRNVGTLSTQYGREVKSPCRGWRAMSLWKFTICQ